MVHDPLELPEQRYKVRQLSRRTASELSLKLLGFSSDQPWENWTRTELLADRPRKWSLSLVLFRSSEPVAYAVVSNPSVKVHHLHRLAVAPAERRKGLGRELIKIVQRRAASEAAEVMLKVYSSNGVAIAFYERLGFVTLDKTGDQLRMSSS